MTDIQNIRNNVSSSAADNIHKWLTQPKYQAYKDELETLITNQEWQILEDSFFKVIEFGTAGRRGQTGIGSNRINTITIGESAQALCEYALEADSEARKNGVVIAYDTRISSPELSRFTAQVCAANGFKTYIFDSFRSTPELSFAVRYLHAAIGIVISASHNPPRDNGFKAYWNDGAQIAAPHDQGILDKAAEINEIKMLDFNIAMKEGLIIEIGKVVDEAYIEAVLQQAEGVDRDVAIIYSPLHGAGSTNVLPVFRAAGFKNISLVTDQMNPDGNFSTVESNRPNPQEKSANDRAVAQLLAEKADIAITNDPDADRLGVMVRRGDKVSYLTGSQSFAIAADYSLRKLKEKNKLTSNHYVARTFVTTDIVDAIAKHYGATYYNNLPVGFKYFGALIKSKENTSERFVIGGEESYGALKGDYARDKDGASAALPLAEYAAELKKAGKTLYDRMLELFVQHGIYQERMDNIRCPGVNGFEQMKNIMKMLRTDTPQRIGEYEVTEIIDYSQAIRRNLVTGKVERIDYIKNNTISLIFGDQRKRITVRPSGTEPVMKCYVAWYEDVESMNIGEVDHQVEDIEEKLKKIGQELERLLIG